MNIIEVIKDESIAFIKMTNGENRLNPDFNAQMVHALNELENDPKISAVIILSGDKKSWSQGIDTAWIHERLVERDLQSIRTFLYDLNALFKKILLYPMPIIAAINGHAVAGGAILACACDFRFMRSDRGFFFVSEIDVGIPFLPGMIAIMRKAIPEVKLGEMIYTGKRYSAHDLEPENILKSCKDEESLLDEAILFAKSFNKKRGIFYDMKYLMNKQILEILDKEDPSKIEPLRLLVNY